MAEGSKSLTTFATAVKDDSRGQAQALVGGVGHPCAATANAQTGSMSTSSHTITPCLYKRSWTLQSVARTSKSACTKTKWHNVDVHIKLAWREVGRVAPGDDGAKGQVRGEVWRASRRQYKRSGLDCDGHL